jgi:hypothetical protein
MALLIDGPPSTIDELTSHDSQLLNVASSEGIDVTQKLALAQRTTALEVEGLLRNRGHHHLPLAHVVVTPWLRMWHTYATLELVYADAYNSQLNDRYAGKRDQFRALARWAYDKLVHTGLGVTDRPIPQAAQPAVVATEGTLADDTYYVTMAWVNAGGEEGASAVPSAITTSSSAFLVAPPAAPAAATGWNVYAGTAPGAMVRQNDAPIPTDQTWQQSAAPNSTGAKPGEGQAPSRLLAVPRILQRG